MKRILIAATWAGLTVLPNAALAQTPPPTPTPATGAITSLPAQLKPHRLAATVIAVDDMAAQEKWYETVFGFSKIGELPKPKETILSLDPKEDPQNPKSVLLVLQAGTNRQPGATTYGRLVIHTDNAAGLAAFLQTHGVAITTISPGRVFYVNDPEGNRIEIWQPAAG